MRFYTSILELKTKKEFEIINITKKIKEFISPYKIQEGFLNIYSKHTTLGLKINENEKLLLKDIEWFMNKIVPKKRKYHHDMIELRKDCPENEPKNARGHLMNLFLEHTQTIPFYKYKLQLGKYQEIFAIETSGPRKREIVTQIYGI